MKICKVGHSLCLSRLDTKSALHLVPFMIFVDSLFYYCDRPPHYVIRLLCFPLRAEKVHPAARFCWKAVLHNSPSWEVFLFVLAHIYLGLVYMYQFFCQSLTFVLGITHGGFTERGFVPSCCCFVRRGELNDFCPF